MDPHTPDTAAASPQQPALTSPGSPLSPAPPPQMLHSSSITTRPVTVTTPCAGQPGPVRLEHAMLADRLAWTPIRPPQPRPAPAARPHQSPPAPPMLHSSSITTTVATSCAGQPGPVRLEHAMLADRLAPSPYHVPTPSLRRPAGPRRARQASGTSPSAGVLTHSTQHRSARHGRTGSNYSRGPPGCRTHADRSCSTSPWYAPMRPLRQPERSV